jgi:uncharacterized protein YcnI
MKRVVGTVAAVVLLAGAAPAWGHAELEQGSVPADRDERLTMKVPVEPPGHADAEPPLEQRHNTRVTIEIPDGFRALQCSAKPGWECAVKPAAGRTPHHVAFSRTGPPYEKVDVFAFTVHTARNPGRYPFETNQAYSDGDRVSWDGPAGSETPAPVVEVR